MAKQDDVSALVTWLQTNRTLTSSEHSSTLKPYRNAARWLPIAVGPFVDFSKAIHAGAAKLICEEPPIGTEEEDLVNFEMISAAFPDLTQALTALKADKALIQSFIRQLSTAAKSARAEDTNSCRKLTREYILTPKNTDMELNDPNTDLAANKLNQGWKNCVTARLLCPLSRISEFDEDPQLFMKRVLKGTIKIKASQWPSFLYPENAVFNREKIDEGLFRGDVLLLFLRNIFTGPGSIREGKRKATKPSKAEIHGMNNVFGRAVAYAAVQAYFSLSSIEQWSSSLQEGSFKLDHFFNSCVGLFENDPDDPWVKETLNYLTAQLPSLKREYKQKRKRSISTMSSDESDEDQAQVIYAQRKARRLAQMIARDGSIIGEPDSDKGAAAKDQNKKNISSDSENDNSDNGNRKEIKNNDNDSYENGNVNIPEEDEEGVGPEQEAEDVDYENEPDIEAGYSTRKSARRQTHSELGVAAMQFAKGGFKTGSDSSDLSDIDTEDD